MSVPPNLRNVLPAIGSTIKVATMEYTVSTVEPATDYSYYVEAFTTDNESILTMTVTIDRCEGCSTALPNGSNSICRMCSRYNRLYPDTP